MSLNRREETVITNNSGASEEIALMDHGAAGENGLTDNTVSDDIGLTDDAAADENALADNAAVNEIVVPDTFAEGIIGIQGQQGGNDYHYWSTGCQGVTHTEDTKNTTNIYNYMAYTGCMGPIGPTGPTGPMGGVINAPTEVYLGGYFDHYGAEFPVTVTSKGYTVPFQRESYNQIQPIMNTLGRYVQFQIREWGTYEIDFSIYLKEAVEIGARIRYNTTIIDSSIINPDSEVSHLSTACLCRCSTNDLISLELFTYDNAPITLNGIVAGTITIKRLSR